MGRGVGLAVMAPYMSVMYPLLLCSIAELYNLPTGMKSFLTYFGFSWLYAVVHGQADIPITHMHLMLHCWLVVIAVYMHTDIIL